MTAALAVYVIHYDRPDWCASSVESILGSTGTAVDLTVVDNGQRDGVPLDRRLPRHTRVLRLATNRGYTGAANEALLDWRTRRPDDEYCVIASHDLHVAAGTLARLVEVADRRPDAGIVAPALVAPDAVAGGIWARSGAKQVVLEPEAGVVARDWASGTCLLLRRRCVESVGPFDERFHSYVEDVDYGLRARRRGWSVLVVTDAHARGLGSATGDAWARRAANATLVSAKRGGAPAALVAGARFAWSIARYGAAGLWPAHDADRRARARTAARDGTRALVRLVGDGRLLDVVRHPDRVPWPRGPSGVTHAGTG